MLNHSHWSGSQVSHGGLHSTLSIARYASVPDTSEKNVSLKPKYPNKEAKCGARREFTAMLLWKQSLYEVFQTGIWLERRNYWMKTRLQSQTAAQEESSPELPGCSNASCQPVTNLTIKSSFCLCFTETRSVLVTSEPWVWPLQRSAIQGTWSKTMAKRLEGFSGPCRRNRAPLSGPC